MTNYYGPAVVPFAVPATDPLLDLLLESFAAVVNYETKQAWQSIYKIAHDGEAEILPVRRVISQDPRKFASSFNSQDLPALYAWRGNVPRHFDAGQSLEHRESMVHVMWVMPLQTRNSALVRDAFGNAIDAVIHNFVRQQRHVAWKKQGDTYADAQTRGSVLGYHTRLVSIHSASSEETFVELVQLDPVTGAPAKTTRFDAWTMSFRVVEKNERDWSLVYPALDRVEVTMDVPPGTLAGETAARTVEDADFKLTIVSITPSTGPLAGGTSVTIKIRQGSASMAVTIGGVAATSVAVVDETTLTATTPAGVSTGAKDVVASRLDVGDSATLAGGFTYT